MKKSYTKKINNFYTMEWFLYVLVKLDLADDPDITARMITSIRTYEIEQKILMGTLFK